MDNNYNPRITFLGGAGTVTGSKILLEFKDRKILIDCGLFQGLKTLRLKNWAEFPVDPKTIDAIILTHAHLDHCGYIPVLVKRGFSGEIHCTHPTKDMAEIILKDSAKIQEEDANRANKYGYSKHTKAEALYTVKDVIASLPLFKGHEYSEWVIINEFMKFEFHNSGHILGGALVNLKINDKHIVFSGDIGRLNPMLLYPPKVLKHADYIVMESTYGDRVHSVEQVKEELLKTIKETIQNKGILMIPSFAVERTQELVHLLYELKNEGRLPKIDIYLDSPMGINVSHVYMRYPSWQNISQLELKEMFNDVFFINDYEQSKALVEDKKSKIILAGSGMIEGGRILHYLNNHIDNPKDTLLFVGYQGIGTRGRAIRDGASEVKFFGEFRKVNCQVRSIGSLSAHADRNEIVTWLKHFKTAPKILFLNHGEPHQADALRVKIEHDLKWKTCIPELNDTYLLGNSVIKVYHSSQ
ncbi:MAG: MBL fold metallo-hydrolase [Crocinitomicaceae bacterium]|jgi:metallo-beta-lactamase family protein|nr:MBL fold metallo-hydrolase [Crocinitomicaceae bacterium]